MNLQNIQTIHEGQYQKKKKKKKKNQKLGRRSKQTFLQRRHTDGPKANEMIFYITSY